MMNEFKKINNELTFFGLEGIKRRIQFLTVKNALKKDMEVVIWKVKLSQIFEDFEIYSNPSTELNAFEMAVCREYTVELNSETENMIYFVTSLCIDNFFDLVFKNKNQITPKELEMLSEKYTAFILDVENVNFYDENELTKIKIKSLFDLYIKGGGDDPTTVDNFLNLKALILK